jgi:chromosome partitioning protein
MASVVALVSVKGGVGKTTTAVNLAALAADAGLRTLLWDLDPQGAATFLLRVDSTPDASFAPFDPATDVSITDYDSLDVLRTAHAPGEPARLERSALRTGLARLAPWYDVVMFDCEAGLDEHAQEAVTMADIALVPVLPTPLGVRTLEQLDRFVARSSSHAVVLPFFSMVDRRRRLHREVVEALQVARPATLSAQVVDSAIVERMGARREPVVRSAPATGAAESYRALWREVASILATRTGTGASTL